MHPPLVIWVLFGAALLTGSLGPCNPMHAHMVRSFSITASVVTAAEEICSIYAFNRGFLDTPADHCLTIGLSLGAAFAAYETYGVYGTETYVWRRIPAHGVCED